LGGFVEQIAAGTFAKTLQEQDIRALFNHDEDHVLGRLKAGTLRLAEDADGLAYEIDMPDTTVGRDLAVSLERGDISGSSFGFRMIKDEWEQPETGVPIRTLREVSLRDVGPVTFPAYSDASSALRSLSVELGVPVDDLVAAGKANELRSLFTPVVDELPAEVDVERREAPTFTRPRLAWLQ
jgi:hypothetical protein